MSNENILKLDNITKIFPGVVALDKMHFTLKKGEIHAIIGENGAGKSTLMKIIAGIYQPDDGKIYLDDEPVEMKNPLDSEQKGISIVHQELSVFKNLSASENIFLNHQPRNRFGLIDYRKMNKRVQHLLDEYHLNDIEPEKSIFKLSVGRQQMIEILRAVNENAKVIIFDEPTSALTEKEKEILFTIMRRLNNEGISIIYISHRLEEIFEICDRVTVMRDGKYIQTFDVADTTKDELVAKMVGRNIAYNYGAGTSEITDDLLKLTDLTSEPYFRNISFTLRKGEILGLAGLEGAGRTELLESIFGINKIESGLIEINGKEARIKSPNDAKKNDIAYISKERKTKGLFIEKNIKENMFAVNIDRFTRNGLCNYSQVETEANEYKDKFSIKTPSINKLVRELSGGNQQKVLMSMWISREPSILLIDEPTRGIDVGTKESIHLLIRDLAKEGMGVIMVSSDMPEIIGACDRVIALYEGEVSGELKRSEITEEKIMSLTSGIKA